MMQGRNMLLAVGTRTLWYDAYSLHIFTVIIVEWSGPVGSDHIAGSLPLQKQRSMKTKLARFMAGHAFQ
jgi:hypothetical protein